MRALVAALALLALSASASAQTPARPDDDIANDLPAAVSEDQISVSSDYRGSYVTVFGFNPDRRGRGDIVVVVRGPPQPVTVMRKRQVFGLWINSDPVRFAQAPSFFAVLSTRPLGQITNPTEIWRHGLDPAASAQLESGTPPGTEPATYRRALTRLRLAQGLYQYYSGQASPDRRGGITLYQRGLFRAVVRLPANAPIAEYRADTYLFRDGRLISRQQIPIRITRIGVERRIHDLATGASVLYGLLTVLLALAAGWVAAFLFRRQ
ncbi:TIGR02186 family protein [Terricaulis sp.]|uniref:TIGR02186 family protein n=1 Tax=Terricaulis sp. TaxID=2768686 RepID=UPI0037848465